MQVQKLTGKIISFVKNLSEKVLLTVLLLGSGYGYFHFGIEDRALVIILQILFLLIFLWIIIVRFSRPGGETESKKAKPADDSSEKRDSDVDVIQKLADHYHLKRRGITEQEFKDSLTDVLTTIKTTFVSYSAMTYLWDQEKNLFLLKAWDAGDAEVNENHALSPDDSPISKIVAEKQGWINGSDNEKSVFSGCFSKQVEIKSILASPVLLEDEVAGIIVVCSLSEETYGSDDESLLRMFSGIVSKTVLNFNSIYEFETSSWLFSSFYEISKELNLELKFSEVLDMLMRIAHSIMEYDRISISLVEENGESAKIIAVEGQEDEFTNDYVFPLDEGLNGWVIRRNKPILVSDLERGGEYFIPRYTKGEKSNYDLRSFLAAPIGFSNKCLGVISIESKKPNVYVERHENILVMLCNNIGAALERSIIYQKLESMATTDGLTGLNNYRSFRLRLNEEINRARRYQMQFSLLMLDIDHFKKFNDTYGHLVGDRVLQNISEILSTTLRNIDYVARYGGEEFCAILLNTVGKAAKLSAERIRINIEQNPLKHDGTPLPSTVSIGVAMYPDDSDQEDDLIDCADKALYRAKASGRNRVVMYNEGLEKQ